MAAKIIGFPTKPDETAKHWERRYWRQAEATNRMALKAEMTRLRAKRFAEIVAENAGRSGDSYLAQEACAFLEMLDKER